MKFLRSFYLLIICAMLCHAGKAQTSHLSTNVASQKLTLWYNAPAKIEGEGKEATAMNETLPIGTSKIGALIFGGTTREQLVLNDQSLWTGDEKDEGSYQTLANLFLNLPRHQNITNYRRDLNLANATAHVNYEANGTNYSREYFASKPARLIVIHLGANKPGAYTGSLELNDMHNAKTISSKERELIASGTLSNGLKYETRLRILNSGGSVKSDGDKLIFNKCNSLTILVAAGTNYIFDYSKSYHGEAPGIRLGKQINAASLRDYPSLKAEHIRDYRSLFGRVTLDLGTSLKEQKVKPTNLRKSDAATGTDPEMESLLFQYGRYLLISCSRPGGLPANLQGLWNDSNNAAWGSDYHDNINVEMNYWPAESANISECAIPFFDLIKSQLIPWRKATAAAPELNTIAGQPTARGFALRTSHNIYGHTDWKWDKTANAWYCQILWEHYAFGQNKDYLKTVAYPIMKETCEFWEDHLKTLPDGQLVVPEGWSPEHGPTEDGVSYNQQIVWDLFNNYSEATVALSVDHEYGMKIAAMRDKLLGPKIGKWGQLQEWMEDKDDPHDHHRHTSNLFAVFPGRQVSIAKTPALAKAARVSLDARGPTGDVREWSFAWRTALYARLHDAEDAHAMLKEFFKDRNSCLNLFGLHPPMQMDGNFGMTAAITEMLVQSHEGEINLLPALPSAWKSGAVTGLKARGGFAVDISWKDSKLVSAILHNINGATCVVRYADKLVKLDNIKKGESRKLTF